MSNLVHDFMSQGKITVKAAAVGVIIAAMLIGYGGSLSNGFHWDDAHAILKNPSVKSIGAALETFIDPMGFSVYRLPMIRPLTVVTYAINYRMGGFNPVGWHILNLLLHLFSSLAVMGVGGILLGRAGYGDGPRLWGGLAAALVFAVHPIQSEALNYFSARSSLLAAAGCLSAFFFHLHHDESGDGRWRIAGTASFVAGLLSRENAAVLPAILLAAEFVSPPGGKSRLKSAATTWPYWIILVAYMIYRRVVLGEIVGGQFIRGPLEQAGIDMWAIGLCHKLLAFPWHTSVHHPHPAHLAASPLFWAGIFLLGGEMTAVMAGSSKRKSVATAGLTMFYLGLLPTLAIPLNFPFAEHRAYLAMAGVAIVAGWAVADVSRVRYKFAAVVLLAASLVLAGITRKDNRRWKSELTLWRAALVVNPMDYFSWTQYGRALKDERKDIHGAIAAYLKSIEIHPTGAAYNNLSTAYELSGDKNRSREAIRRAIEIAPANPYVRMNYALTLAQDGRLKDAEQHFREAIRLLPVFPEAHKNLAVILLARKPPDFKDALKHLEISLGQDPYQKEAAAMKKAIFEIRRKLKDESGQ